tara:strand:- start:897 stop:1001 length:105 start_codon:yes stop_codon:yes gene_type:complete
MASFFYAAPADFLFCDLAQAGRALDLFVTQPFSL